MAPARGCDAGGDAGDRDAGSIPSPQRRSAQVNMRRRGFLTGSAAGLTVGLLPGVARAAPAASRTETVYLSGRDKDHPVDWEFMVASGRRSNTWSVIPT